LGLQTANDGRDIKLYLPASQQYGGADFRLPEGVLGPDIRILLVASPGAAGGSSEQRKGLPWVGDRSSTNARFAREESTGLQQNALAAFGFFTVPAFNG
jgi:hypothetical protein